MITSLKFERFRGFTELKISPVKRINLIAGANNTGKTAILEGLVLLLAARERMTEDLVQLPGRFRSNVSGSLFQMGISPSDDFLTFWQALFYDKEMNSIPRITATFKSRDDMAGCFLRNVQDNILIKYLAPNVRQLPPNFPEWLDSLPPSVVVGKNQIAQPGPARAPNQFATRCIIISTRMEQPVQDAEIFNQVSLSAGGEEKLVALLREVDPRLEKLRYLKAPGTTQPLVYAHFGLSNAISMTQTGQGFSKLFSLFCQMIVSDAKVVLIDEIENGLYYESLPVIWRGIAALAASEDIQVFATTHSRECIVAAHEALKDTTDYDFSLHRLQRVKDRIEVVSHDREMLDVAIKSGLEVR